MKLNWGTAIVLGFIVFASFVFTLVAKMIGSGNDLLSAKNYHPASEINGDLKLLAASAGLRKGLSLSWHEGSRVLELHLPDKTESGKVRLTCLANAKADHEFRLNLKKTGDGHWIQEETLPLPASGNWLAEIRGRMKGDSFLLKEHFRIY